MAESGETRRLRRSRDRMVAGVAGGIADYLAVDPTIVRLIFAFLFILGVGFTWPLVYLLLWMLMPEASTDAGTGDRAASGRADPGADSSTVFGVLILGFVLLLLANQFALTRIVGFGAARAAWPLLLIAGGAALFLVMRDRQRN